MEKNNPNLNSMKSTAKNNLKTQFNLSRSIQHVGIVAIENEEIRNFVVKGLSDIGLGALVLGEDKDFGIANISSSAKLNSNNLLGFDFFIYDNEFEGIDVVKYMGAGIVPIMPHENTFSGMLKDFNPMNFEGNGFFWKKDSPFCIFEKVVSYLENIRFPEDKRILLKNVISTF